MNCSDDKAAVADDLGFVVVGFVVVGFLNFCVCVPVALYPFASGPCFMTSVLGLNSLLFNLG